MLVFIPTRAIWLINPILPGGGSVHANINLSYLKSIEAIITKLYKCSKKISGTILVCQFFDHVS